MSSAQTQYLTPQEYLEIERKAAIRSEYMGGRMRAMSGASRRHIVIVGNLNRELSTQLLNRDCETYTNDMRVKVSLTGAYTYPDVVAVCGEPRFEDTVTDTLLNPTAIVEVLSPSTEIYDRGEKFVSYRRISTLRDYVLVAQDKVHVEHYRRSGEEWVLSELSEIGATLHLESIECRVPLAAIYAKIRFDDAKEA